MWPMSDAVAVHVAGWPRGHGVHQHRGGIGRRAARDVDARRCGLLRHRARGLIQRNEQADLGALTVHVALEGSDHVAADVSALELDDDTLQLATVIIEEVDVSIYAGVGLSTSLLVPSSDQAEPGISPICGAQQ